MSTIIAFDESSGQYTFDSNDEPSYPIGEYMFTVTVHVGAKSASVQFKMTLHSYCGDRQLQIIHDMFHFGAHYMLGDPRWTIFSADITTVGTSDATQPCGEPTLEFVYANGNTLAEIFSVIEDGSNVSSLTVFSEEIWAQYAIVHSIQFRFYYSWQPGNYILSSVIDFEVKNPCTDGDTLPTITAPEMPVIYYTITDPAFEYQIPAWTVSDNRCNH